MARRLVRVPGCEVDRRAATLRPPLPPGGFRVGGGRGGEREAEICRTRVPSYPQLPVWVVLCDSRLHFAHLT